MPGDKPNYYTDAPYAEGRYSFVFDHNKFQEVGFIRSVKAGAAKAVLDQAREAALATLD